MTMWCLATAHDSATSGGGGAHGWARGKQVRGPKGTSRCSSRSGEQRHWASKGSVGLIDGPIWVSLIFFKKINPLTKAGCIV